MNGAASTHLLSGRSAIFWNPNFPLSLWHVAHLWITCWTIEFALMTYTPVFLRWFKFNPLALCPMHWWLHQATISEILHFFGRITDDFLLLLGMIFSICHQLLWCLYHREMGPVLQWSFLLEPFYLLTNVSSHWQMTDLAPSWIIDLVLPGVL